MIHNFQLFWYSKAYYFSFFLKGTANFNIYLTLIRIFCTFEAKIDLKNQHIIFYWRLPFSLNLFYFIILTCSWLILHLSEPHKHNSRQGHQTKDTCLFQKREAEFSVKLLPMFTVPSLPPSKLAKENVHFFTMLDSRKWLS